MYVAMESAKEKKRVRGRRGGETERERERERNVKQFVSVSLTVQKDH